MITSFIMGIVNIVSLGFANEENMFINVPIHIFNQIILAFFFLNGLTSGLSFFHSKVLSYITD